MIARSLTKLTAAFGGLALSLAAGAAIASAQPDFEPMINTTCTYDQAMAAIHAENPMAAQYLDSSPPNLEFLRVFIASTPDQRRNLISQVQNNPGAAEAFPIIQQMFASCPNY
ncbi:hemophore-related protein [Mycobacterium barrassiae]|uniref:hemophore-related protein n=1 Tax=Mycobacterium barrassiae TaxID=319709 RepID=UPI002265BB36|nr:hemophore-related protein [Mycobacterium barrassiae]MCV7298536.1 hemophore-related protein [Mycobacterium barrassiae]